MLATHGVSERGHTAAIRNPRIGAGAQENRHDLLIALRAVAEDHRLQQSGPTKIVYVVDIDVAGVRRAARSRRDLARSPGSERYRRTGSDGQIRPSRQEHLEHVDAASHTGDQPRRVVLVIQRIRVCTQIDQQPRDREPVLRDREQEGCALLSSRVSGLALLESRAPRRLRHRAQRQRASAGWPLPWTVCPPRVPRSTCAISSWPLDAGVLKRGI